MPEPRVLGDLHAGLVIVGAGPAGLAAAAAASAFGVEALLLDAAPAAGGQIWRARRGEAAPPVARALARLVRDGVRVLAGTRVVMALPDRVLLVEGADGARCLQWESLVLATGARERLLPFPGWTLPGVFGAGGLQALVKGGWPIRGRRVLAAGTGPLLLAAAASLRREGATVVAVAEEARAAALARFATTLIVQPRKGLQALRLAASLRGVPLLAGHRVVEAAGDGRVQRAVLAGPGGRLRTIECDALAAGWGLLPQTELAQALGCALAPRFGAEAIIVDECQRTSVAGVFAAGECTGVAGARAAWLQGTRAGQAATAGMVASRAGRDMRRRPVRNDAVAEPLAGELPARERPGGTSGFAAAVARAFAVAGCRARENAVVHAVAHRFSTHGLARENTFAEAVARTFPVPGRLPDRWRDDTLVCRCEDVAWAAVRDCADLRSAKLATRCGMGHCQGRLCHDTLATAMHWPRLPPRPPLAAVPLATLLAIPQAPISTKETPR